MGGIVCDPKSMSRGELAHGLALRRAEISRSSAEIDIPSADVYTEAQTMAWIRQTPRMTVDSSSGGGGGGKWCRPSAFLGGSRTARDATGRGVLYVRRGSLQSAEDPFARRDGRHSRLWQFGVAWRGSLPRKKQDLCVRIPGGVHILRHRSAARFAR